MNNLARNLETMPLRVALYIRVSTDEQAIKGLSLEAQQEDLMQHVKEQGWTVAGIYVDAAKTARKRIYKRAEFLRMLEDVKEGKIDRILCTRLDRWFRNVGDYYKVMEILEKNHCDWSCTQEQYDTSTAGGRLYINMKLSIAQNEADQTGERINVVFDSKIQNGTVVSGSAPFWLRINEEKRLEIIPEKAAILKDAFDHYEATVTKRGTITYIRNKYGLNWCEATFSRMLKDKLAIGVYDKNGRYNPSFCPAAISEEQFNHIQELMKRNGKTSPSGRIYLFTSLLVCAECKHNLVGYKNGKNNYYYRCNQHFKRSLCIHNHSQNEQKIERWLLNNLASEIEKCKIAYSVNAAAKERSSRQAEKAALKNKLTKLKELYVNDLIDLEDYKKDYEIYSAALANIPDEQQEKAPDFSLVEHMMQNGFKEIYEGLSREEKRTFWRSIIKKIEINNDGEITGIFFG